MTVRGHSLASFVPALLARHVVTAGAPGAGPATAEVAVLGLDISESTAMTEDVAKRDADGPERVAGALNTIFTALADGIVAGGGSVVTLAGDEVVAAWPADDHGGLAEAAHLATGAAVRARERARSLPPVGGHAVRLRAGVGAGTGYLLDLGGEHGRRLFVAAGPAFQEMAAAQHAVAPSEIGLGPSVRGLLGGRAVVEAAGTGAGVPGAAAAAGAARLVELAAAPAGHAGAPAPAAPPLPDAVAARYVPDAVFEGLRTAGRLRAELSPVTVAFVSLRTGPWRPEGSVVVSEASLEVLRAVAAYEGTLVSARQDLDGVTLLAAFGLPPVVREYEAARAALCALEVAGALKGYVEHGVGIATGHAFCGVFGSDAYRQYTVVGPIVNLGARLMQQAQNEVLCDEVTQRLARERLRFSSRGLASVRGLRQPVAVYRPEWHEREPGLPALGRLSQRAPELLTRGRDRERQELAGRLVALGLGTSSAVVVEGDPGSGKTHLAVDLLRSSDAYGRIVALVGGGDEMDRRPYQAWKPVLTQALGLFGVRDPAERAEAVRRRLEPWPELRDWTPLVADVLDLAAGGDPLRDMTGSARRENTIRVLLHLLAGGTSGLPALLALDDCQWMDSASWELVRAVHRDMHPLMLALFTRPLADAAPGDGGTAAEVLRTLRERGALWLRLGPLAPDDTEQIARDALAVARLDAPLRPLFREKVGGSPLFAVELAFQLRSDQVISVDGGDGTAHAHLAVPEADLARLRLPVRVEEVFRARLSALTERQRAVIRAASVVGSSFDVERVEAADPELAGDGDRLEPDLLGLERLKVVERDGAGWRFQHALIRDVALQSSLPSELRERHRALAAWYERQGPDPDTYAIVARHWEAAGDAARQVEYLEAAGTTALLRGAEEEAVALTRAALALDERRPGELEAVTDERRAFWHSQVGEALTARNRLDEAVGSLTAALGTLGRRVPRSRAGWLLRLLLEILRQVAHLVRPARARPGRRGDRGGAAHAAEIFSLLAETQYFRWDTLAWTASNLAAVNLAEQAGDPALAGRAYSGLGNLAGTLRLHRLAARYFRRSRQEAATPRHGTASPLTRAVMPDLTWEHDITAAISEAVYLRTMNRSPDVVASLDGVVVRLREAGLNQPLEIALAVRGFLHGATGALHAARADFEELVSSARRRSNASHLTWGLTLLVPVLLGLGRHQEAARLDAEATAVFEEHDRLSGPNYHGSHLQALVSGGAIDEALGYAGRAVRGVAGTPTFFHLAGLTSLVEASLDLLAASRAHEGAGARDAERLARRSLRALRRYVRLYPFARGRYRLHAGRYHAVRGRHAAARRHWRRGLPQALEARLLLDAARLRLHLAAGLPQDSPERVAHEREARRVLADLGLGGVVDAPGGPGGTGGPGGAGADGPAG